MNDQLKIFENLVAVFVYTERAYYSLLNAEFFLNELGVINDFKSLLSDIVKINTIVDDKIEKFKIDDKERLFSLFKSKKIMESITHDYVYNVYGFYKINAKVVEKLDRVKDKIYDDEIQLSQKFKNDVVKKK